MGGRGRCDYHHQFLSICAVKVSLMHSEATLGRKGNRNERERTVKRFLLLEKLKCFYLFVYFEDQGHFLSAFESKTTEHASCNSAAAMRKETLRESHAFCDGGQQAAVRQKNRASAEE